MAYPKGPQPVKLTGKRSLATKLQRLAYELEHDAARVRADHPGQASVANALTAISSQLGGLGRVLETDHS